MKLTIIASLFCTAPWAGAQITLDDKFDILLGESQSSGLIMEFYENFIHKQGIEYDGKVITEESIQAIRGELISITEMPKQEINAD